MPHSLSRHQALGKLCRLPSSTCHRAHVCRGVPGRRGVTRQDGGDTAGVPFLPTPGSGGCHHSQRVPWSTLQAHCSQCPSPRASPHRDLQDLACWVPTACCPGWPICPNALSLFPLFSGSQLGAAVLPRKQLAMSGDIFGCHISGGVATKSIETRDAALDPTVHGTAPPTPSTDQWCGGRETLTCKSSSGRDTS